MTLFFVDQHREPDISGSPIEQLSNDGLKNVNSEDGLVTKTRSFGENGCEAKLDIEEYVLQGALPKESKISTVDSEESFSNQKLKSLLKQEDADDDKDYLTQKIKMLQLRLEDAQKAIDAEKE